MSNDPWIHRSDIGYQDADHVIVFGRYKGVDYVQSYAINTQDFAEIIRILNAMRQHARVRRIDAPPTFHAVFERILK